MQGCLCGDGHSKGGEGGGDDAPLAPYQSGVRSIPPCTPPLSSRPPAEDCESQGRVVFPPTLETNVLHWVETVLWVDLRWPHVTLTTLPKLL